MVTVSLGRLSSTTVKVAVLPASVVLPLMAETETPAVSSLVMVPRPWASEITALPVLAGFSSTRG